MISEILPTGIASAEDIGDDLPVALLPEEADALGPAAEGRRREFAAARACAHRALTQLGCPPSPVLRGSQREPIWPAGVTGSITHCARYRAAAVGRTQDVLSLGIDAEVHDELPAGILGKIALPQERQWIRRLRDSGVCWDRFLFSAKESTYKAWFPLSRRWLGFLDACIEVEPTTMTFQVRLLNERLTVDGREIDRLQGRFRVSKEIILTFVGIPKE